MCKKRETQEIWKNDPKNTTKKDNYKNYVKILNQIINKAKENYDKKLIESNQNNQKNLWKIINTKLGKNSKKKENINYIKENNRIITDSNLIADIMNKFFSNVGTKLTEKITPPQNETIKLPPMNKNSIFIHPATKHEIIKIIANLKSKNGGIDGINATSLKILTEHISDSLVHIINNSIEKGVWPDALKMAEITPIHKGKRKHSPNN